MPFLFLAVIAVFGLAVTVAIWTYQRHKARLASLATLCQSKGWQFTPHDPFGLPQRWGGTPFDTGYAKRAENVVTGEHEGMPLVAFDYSYKEDSNDSDGKKTTTYRYAIVALGMPCALPELHLAPENVLTRIGSFVGLQDIDLESEDFNRRYRVRCPDPKFASDVLSPRTMEFLLANDTVCFRLAGSDAVSFERRVLDPYVVLRAAHVLAGVVRGVPSFVWRDHGGDAAPRPVPSPGNLT